MRTKVSPLLCFVVACTGHFVDGPDVPIDPRDAAADVQRSDTSSDALDPADAGPDALDPTDAGPDALDATTEDAAPDSASDVGEDAPAVVVSCAAIDAHIDGASTCRDEAERCSVRVPSTSTCAETCQSMDLQCLRAYRESSSCLPALELGELACDASPDDAAFCQCGDASAVYDPWVVVTIGDSTMANRSTPGELGWGDQFPMFGVRPDDIVNEGSSGASSLDFETRSNWPRAEALLGPNVFLLIQFGHNDGSSDPGRRTEPGEAPTYEGTYHDRLDFYVEAARTAGATPIIATSMGHMRFDGDVAADSGVTRYANSATAYAEREGLMLIDGHRVSRSEYTRVGPEETIARYSFDETTHFSPEGALRLAELMARASCIESELLCAQFTFDR